MQGSLQVPPVLLYPALFLLVFSAITLEDVLDSLALWHESKTEICTVTALCCFEQCSTLSLANFVTKDSVNIAWAQINIFFTSSWQDLQQQDSQLFQLILVGETFSILRCLNNVDICINVSQHQTSVHCNPIYKQNCVHILIWQLLGLTASYSQMQMHHPLLPVLFVIQMCGTWAQTHCEDL